MKTTILKILLGVVLAAAVGYGVWYVLREMGTLVGPDRDATEIAGDAMVQARAMFTEKPDDIQTLTAALLSEPGLEFLRDADGDLSCLRDGRPVTPDLPPEAQAALEAAFGDYACGGKLLQIIVHDDAVLFFTDFTQGGCAGFLYEVEMGTTAYYDYVELVENWKIFYRIPK